MKKLPYSIPALLLLFFSVLLLPACQSTRSATASKMLRFNLEKGKVYDYEMEMNMDQEVMGMATKINMTTYYSMAVKEDDGKTKTIDTRYERFKMLMDMAAFKLDVDTEEPADTGSVKENPMLMMKKVFGAIKGQQFRMKVDAEGNVVEVSGFQEMAEKIVSSMELDPENEKEAREEMKKAFGKQFNDAQIKEQFGRFLYIFPDKEVKVGDSWTKSTSMNGVLAGQLRSVYKVTEIEGDMVTLEEKSAITGKTDDQEVSGEQTGTLVVDSRSGLVVTAEVQMNMKTKVGGMEIPIKMKTKVKGVAR